MATAQAVEANGLSGLTGVSGWDGTRLSYWLRGCSPTGPVMNGRFMPNSPIPDITSGSAKITGPRSRHPGGVNASFCDGSVQFLVDSIDARTWHALWTKAGNEVISGSAW